MRASRIGLGTWAIGGWMWGGTDESESVSAIHAALEQGINVVDTAPVYGFGRSEEIVGKALAEPGLRSRAIIATKVGLEWRDGKVFRNASRGRIMRELEDSLRRLRTDYIDIYQVHWPDPLVPIEETAEAMGTLYKQGKIRAIGVSNFSVEQMERFRRVAPLHVLQSPYNLFERGIEAEILPYCRKTTSPRWAMGRSAGGSSPAGCGAIRASAAMICAGPTRNSSSRASRTILPPCSGSIGSPGCATASVSSTWRCAGCSTRASPSHCGARRSDQLHAAVGG